MDIQLILTTVGAFLGSALGMAIVGGVVKGIFGACASKLDAKKNAKENAKALKEEFVDKIKDVSFEQNIMPIVKSELEKVNENATKVATEQLEELQVKYDKLLAVMEKIVNYFDDAPLILEEKKAEAHKAIDEAKEIEAPEKVESFIVVEEEKPQEAPINIAEIKR